MKKNLITTQYDHKDHVKCEKIKIKGASLTVPNQAISPRDLLSRSGVMMVGHTPTYSGEYLDPTKQMGFDEINALNLIKKGELTVNQLVEQQKVEDDLKDVKEDVEPAKKDDIQPKKEDETKE